MTKLIFPLLTAPGLKNVGYLNELRLIVGLDFKDLIVVSPFVDAFIISNIIKRAFQKDRKITVITRYENKAMGERQKKEIDKALLNIDVLNKSDPSIENKICWYNNKKVHAKFVVADWRIVLFGSQNLVQHGGLSVNYELGALIEDPETVVKLKPFVKALIDNAARLYPKS